MSPEGLNKEVKVPKMQYMIEHVYKIKNDLHPRDYYTMIKFKVPSPQTSNDKPVILVSLYNAKEAIMLPFTSMENLNRIFNLDAIQEGLFEDLAVSLQTAETVRQIRLNVEEHFAREEREKGPLASM